jgi:mono/diheme cytochrome c family protein
MKRSLVVLVLALSTVSAAENATQAKPAAASTDAKTLMGWKTWRALACERCHGAEQEGLVGPPLVETLKTLSKEDFHAVMMNGRPEKGMPPFNGSQMVNENWEGLYAYLKGRSDGKIAPGRLTGIEQP